MKAKNNIQKIRWERKVTQRELATRSGVSPSTVADIENGLQEPRQSTMIMLAKALELPVTEVFDLEWRDEQ